MSESLKIDSTPEELLLEARQRTNISIEDTEAMAPLTHLIQGLNRTAQFRAGAAAVKRQYILRILMNRLRMIRDFSAHPEIADIELVPPLLINGLPRTGSTKMQKTLAATGDFNFLPYWMCINSASHTGQPNEDVSDRIAEIDEYANWFREVSPETRFGHDMAALEPEEEAYIMMQSMRCSALSGFARADDYLTWLEEEQDYGHQYRYLNQTLKYLIWQGLADPEKPFLLKCVINLGLEKEIIDAIPGVRIAVMHRNPIASVPSGARLRTAFFAAYSDQTLDLTQAHARYARRVLASLQFRRSNPDILFHDICYDDLVRDAKSVIEGVYHFMGMEPSPSALSNVAQWEEKNPKNIHGAWTYRSEDFGFSDEDIREEFSPYYDWLKASGIANWS